MSYKYDCSKLRDKFLTPAPVEWAGGFHPKRRVLNFSCGDIHLLVVAWNLGSFQTQVFSAGNSGYGQLGHGDTKEVHELKPIEALNNKSISKVAAGNFHSLAMAMNGRALFSWGKVDQGALGLFDEEKTLKYEATDYIPDPKEVAFPTTLGKSCLVDVAAGTFYCVFLLALVCISHFHLFQLCYCECNANFSFLYPLSRTEGDTSSFAITDTGAVYSWGYNENSQTGHYNVPGDGGQPDKYGNKPTNLISRPRLLDVIASVNDGIKRSKKMPIAKNCRVTRVSGGGQHSLMVIKRYK